MYLGKPSMSASVDFLKSLSAIRRIEILDILRDGAKNVGQLAACDLGCQAGVSKHLQILHGSGLVSRETRGRQVVYSISPTVRRLCIELDAVAECVLKKQLK